MAIDDACAVCHGQGVPLRPCGFGRDYTCPTRLCDACAMVHEVDHEDHCPDCGQNYHECQCEDEEED